MLNNYLLGDLWCSFWPWNWHVVYRMYSCRNVQWKITLSSRRQTPTSSQVIILFPPFYLVLIIILQRMTRMFGALPENVYGQAKFYNKLFLPNCNLCKWVPLLCFSFSSLLMLTNSAQKYFYVWTIPWPVSGNEEFHANERLYICRFGSSALTLSYFLLF